MVTKIFSELYFITKNAFLFLGDFLRLNCSIPEREAKQLFILGNGPSLKENLTRDLKTLQANCCMAVNKFALSESFESVKPRYYVFLDHQFFYTKDRLEKLEPQVSADITNTFKSILLKVKWPMTIFIPAQDKARTKAIRDTLEQKNPFLKFAYFSKRNFQGNSDLLFYSKSGMPGGMNVLHACLTIAIRMKFPKIILIGADHTWHENMKYDSATKSLYLDDSHFNRVLRRTFAQMNTNMAQECFCLYHCFKPYSTILRLANKYSCQIFNCSSISYIDTFPFAEISSFSLPDQVEIGTRVENS